VGTTSRPPKWIKPQFTRIVNEAPSGKDWVHEIKYDGYRMHARIDGGQVKLLTRTGLDWSRRYERTRATPCRCVGSVAHGSRTGNPKLG
jgi:ATP-dependent DNA ligase